MMAAVYSRSANSSLIVTNVILMGIALILITFGGIVQGSFSLYAKVLHGYVSVPAVLIIAFGVLLLFVSLFGFVSTAYESYLLLKIYISMLILIVFLEVALGTTGFGMKSFILHMTLHAMAMVKPQYVNSSSSTFVWDALQTNFNCCGVNSYKEWFEFLDNNSVPDSCCRNHSLPHCGHWAVEDDNVRKDGCANSLFHWVHSHQVAIGVICVSLISIKVVAILITCSTSRRIERENDVKPF